LKTLFEARLRRPDALVARLADGNHGATGRFAIMAVVSILLLGFAPAVWIFAESTDSLGFMGTLAIGSWIIAVLFALRFLKSVIFVSGGTQKGPLFIWSVVFLLVTLQMTTSLRPICFGSSRRRASPCRI
jgi:hypothetical protein